MNKQQRDEYEQKKTLWIIKDLRARGVYNSADVILQHYEYIVLAESNKEKSPVK
ncbi:hypothetical protein [Bacillus thuringiensis]|uniref:hypothetical protein n=1 Tax=Bacillus thuringiensis TaxID=1428 RepID=UPI000A92E4AB|nr:hypothetical protein [Bacillus thuringiensis]MED1303857.1 hypothetical protein [Bacillus pacificus]